MPRKKSEEAKKNATKVKTSRFSRAEKENNIISMISNKNKQDSIIKQFFMKTIICDSIKTILLQYRQISRKTREVSREFFFLLHSGNRDTCFQVVFDVTSFRSLLLLTYKTNGTFLGTWDEVFDSRLSVPRNWSLDILCVSVYACPCACVK